jgi:hypothetical protein
MASRKWWNKASLVASIALVFGCLLLQHAPAAAQDQGPILTPKPKPQTSASPTLLVLCDLTCDWKLDGVAQGRIDGGASAKVKVELGQHLVVVVSASNSRDGIERMVEVKGVGQTLVNLKLEPVRNARMQAEQNASQQQQTTQQQTTSQTQQSTAPQSDDSVWTDPATGLMWTRHDNNADANWNEAGSYCQNLRLDGYSDWQLPTVQDLQGILDLSQSSQCGTETCHIKGNIQLTTKWVWTSTPGGEAGHAMYFRFSEGQYLSYPYSDRQLDRVLCVRPGTGGQSAQVQPQTQQRSAPQSDASAWVDLGTNLMWTRHDNNADANWNEAGSYCQNLRLDGYSDWQLPTVQDLQGILDLSQSSQCGTETCHIKGNIQLTTKWVWTSTPGGEAGHAMYFRFSEGQYLSYPYSDRQLDRVLCVRPAGSVTAQSMPSGAVWTDPATGLMWQRSDSGDNNDLTWQQAVNYCRGNSSGGYSDWRLPTVDELVGIYDTSQSMQYSCCGGTSSGVMHVKGGIQMSGEEWTGTEGDGGNGAYRIWLSDSSHSVWTKTESYEGRGICVRR